MRQATIITLFVAAMMSVALFFLKYEVNNLESELNELNRMIVSDRESIHVLEAEWSHLNDIQRLKALTERHLNLRPTDPAQLRNAGEPIARQADKLARPASAKGQAR
jgi:hypothetical protein